MSRGYQADPLVEHAALTELAAAVRQWQDAEELARSIAGRALADGARSHVVAKQLNMSRTTLYRWLAAN